MTLGNKILNTGKGINMYNRIHLNKKRIISSLVICFFTVLCFIIASNTVIIPDGPTPLTPSNIEAMFYIQDSSGTICIGDGLITSPQEISYNESATKAAIVTSPDYSAIVGNSHKIQWHSIRKRDNEYQVLGALVPTSSSVVFLGTYEDMLLADVTPGTIVQTNGRAQQNDGGSAKYEITNVSNSSPDGVFHIKLKNGYYANLIYENNTPLNVALFNVFPNAAVSDELNSAIQLIKGKAIGLQFNNGTYFINKPIKFDSLNYYGNNTTFEVTDDFFSKGMAIFSPLNTKDYFDIELHGIKFIWNISSSQILQNGSNYDIVLLALFNTQHIVIDSCSFICENDTTVHRKVSLLWFKQPDNIKNVSITNSVFINNSGHTLKPTQHLIGGCIWLSGTKDKLCNIENINISNCKIETTLADEAIGIWFCNANNINISNCDITNSYCNNDNVLGLMDGIFENININNSTFNINSPSMYATKMGNLWDTSHVNYDKCTFNINSENLQPYSNAISLFFLYHDKEGLVIDDASTMTINNCVFSTNNSSGKYRCIIYAFGVDDRHILLNNPTINSNISTKESIVNFEKVNDCTLQSINDIDEIGNDPYRILRSNNVRILDNKATLDVIY